MNFPNMHCAVLLESATPRSLSSRREGFETDPGRLIVQRRHDMVTMTLGPWIPLKVDTIFGVSWAHFSKSYRITKWLMSCYDG
jgi:hypothetical protein